MISEQKDEQNVAVTLD